MGKAAPVDRSTLRLSEVARHVVIPEGIVDTLWFEVEERCREFGDTFDVWQDGLGQVTLGLDENGMFTATVGGVTFSIPRQVAKTFIVMVLILAMCTLYPNLTVLWTAHRTRTATNTFQKMMGFVMRPSVRPYLEPGRNRGTAIREANGEQAIPFRNGSAILFGAREQGFGRGFDEVDVIVFDEAQILTEKALEDMVAATNQSRFVHGALLFYMGTPPKPSDPGEVFSERRKDALERKRDHGAADFADPLASGDAVYVECSADPDAGAPDGPSLDDPKQVELANPSYPHRTPPVAVKRLRRNLPGDDGWRREGLGVWDSEGVRLWQVVGKEQWKQLSVPADAAPTDGSLSYGVKFSADGSRFGVGVALGHEHGVHVEALPPAPMAQGLSGLADWLAERWRKASMIVLDGKAGAGDLFALLAARGVSKRRMVLLPTPDAITAHTSFLRMVNEGTLTHLDQPGLTTAASIAGKRKIGTAGGWGWEPLTQDGDVTSLDAVTLAAHGATTSKQRTGRGRSSGNRTSGNRAGVLV